MKPRHRMGTVFGVAALGLAISAAHAEGLSPDRLTVWPQWQGRVSIGTTATTGLAASTSAETAGGLKVQRGSLLGDYYFARNVEPTGRSSGFRATSGLMFGPRDQFGSAPPVMPALGGAFSAQRRHWGLTMPGTSAGAADVATAPYLGIGYSEVSPKGGWGFSADFGLMARNAAPVKFGQAPAGAQSLDDVIRDMRLSPLLQVGVSYSF